MTAIHQALSLLKDERELAAMRVVALDDLIDQVTALAAVERVTATCDIPGESFPPDVTPIADPPGAMEATPAAPSGKATIECPVTEVRCYLPLCVDQGRCSSALAEPAGQDPPPATKAGPTPRKYSMEEKAAAVALCNKVGRGAAIQQSGIPGYLLDRWRRGDGFKPDVAPVRIEPTPRQVAPEPAKSPARPAPAAVDVPVTRRPNPIERSPHTGKTRTGLVCSCGAAFASRTSFNHHRDDTPSARQFEHQLEEPEDDE